MSGPFTWRDLGGERRIDLDPPGTSGGRHLTLRRQPGGEDEWTVACVLEAGRPEQEYGDGLMRGMAEDVALKVAIQGLAQLHGVSAAPGVPSLGAGEAERLIARLWQTLTERWAPGGQVPGPLPAGLGGEEGEDPEPPEDGTEG